MILPPNRRELLSGNNIYNIEDLLLNSVSYPKIINRNKLILQCIISKLTINQ